MPFTATCECGSSYNLKDEFAGQLLECPKCRKTFTADAPAPMARATQADHAFDRDKFLLRQKVMTINQNYEVGDEQNRPILFVQRPAHVMQNLAAVLLAILSLVVLIALGGLGASFFKDNDLIAVILIAGGFLLGIGAALVVGITLSAKRHVTFYRDPTKTEKLLDVLQDAKFQPINATYTVRDKEGVILCRFRKNILYNFFRKRWHVYSPSGTVMCLAMEDSIVLSLLRRFLGPLFGILRTNFIIVRPDNLSASPEDPAGPNAGGTLNYQRPQGEPTLLGEFNRKFTLFDRYVLDLSADPGRTLDRRIALALGLMLDTGERR